MTGVGWRQGRACCRIADLFLCSCYPSTCFGVASSSSPVLYDAPIKPRHQM